jgi:hypothetical protein
VGGAGLGEEYCKNKGCGLNEVLEHWESVPFPEGVASMLERGRHVLREAFFGRAVAFVGFPVTLEP